MPKFSLKTILRTLKATPTGKDRINPERDWSIILVVTTVLLVAVLIMGSGWLFSLSETYGVPPVVQEEEYETTLDVRALEDTLRMYDQKEQARQNIIQNGVFIVDPSL